MIKPPLLQAPIITHDSIYIIIPSIVAKRSPEQIRYRIARNPVFVDGCEEASFIQVPLKADGLIGIIFALVGLKSRQTHSEVYQEAMAAGLISNRQEPTGGGNIDLHTLDLTRSSIHFGKAAPQAVDRLTRYLARRHYERSCD